jgi:hypothetical protein
MYSASIDCTKIDKAKLKDAKYLNVVIVVNDELDKYGNIMSIQEGQTKEERDSKAPKKYLGNGKMFWSNEGLNTGHQEQANTDDSLPF